MTAKRAHLKMPWDIKKAPTIPWVLMVVARERLELSTS